MSIRSKLILVFVSVLFGLVGIFGVNYFGGIFVKQSRKLEVLANEGTAMFLQARRQEKNFLLRKEEEYTQRALECAEKAGSILQKIAVLQPKMTQRCQEALRFLKTYKDSLTKVNELYVAMGLTMNDGLRWDFILAARNMEAAFEKGARANEFVVKLLQMRRQEKNYIIRGDQKYVGRVDKGTAELKKMVNEFYPYGEGNNQLQGPARVHRRLPQLRRLREIHRRPDRNPDRRRQIP